LENRWYKRRYPRIHQYWIRYFKKFKFSNVC
jgi:hypothetical protein